MSLTIVVPSIQHARNAAKHNRVLHVESLKSLDIIEYYKGLEVCNFGTLIIG